MATAAYEFVQLPFMDFFSPFATTEAGAGAHIIAMLGTFALALYGICSVLRYHHGISKNLHLLALSFTLIAFMPIIDIIGHACTGSSYVFLRHLSIFTAVAAFIFLYKFAMRIDSAEQEAPEQSTILLITFGLFSVAYSYWEAVLDAATPILTLAVYSALLFIITYGAYLLFTLLKKMKRIETAFCLKTFVISMVPMLAVCIYLLCLDMIIGEVAKDAIGNTGPFIIRFMYGLEDFLFLSVTLAIVGFAYISGKIQDFYAPLTAFVVQTRPGDKKSKPAPKAKKKGKK